MTTPEQIQDYNAYTLANLADVPLGGDFSGEGSLFLVQVRDALLEAIRFGDTDDDRILELSDNAPDVYTATRWAQFVALSAWHEDLSDLGRPDDMTDAAGVALYLIAERLIRALLAELEVTEPIS